MRGQRRGDGAEQTAEEAAAATGADDGELGLRGQLHQHAGGIALRGAQIDLTGEAAHVLAGFLEQILRCGQVGGFRGNRGGQ